MFLCWKLSEGSALLMGQSSNSWLGLRAWSLMTSQHAPWPQFLRVLCSVMLPSLCSFGVHIQGYTFSTACLPILFILQEQFKHVFSGELSWLLSHSSAGCSSPFWGQKLGLPKFTGKFTWNKTWHSNYGLPCFEILEVRDCLLVLSKHQCLAWSRHWIKVVRCFLFLN